MFGKTQQDFKYNMEIKPLNKRLYELIQTGTFGLWEFYIPKYKITNTTSFPMRDPGDDMVTTIADAPEEFPLAFDEDRFALHATAGFMLACIIFGIFLWLCAR